jgi:hypothetical protein
LWPPPPAGWSWPSGRAVEEAGLALSGMASRPRAHGLGIDPEGQSALLR